MIITLALAAALTADVLIDEDGCRWLRKTAPAARPHTVQRAASAPVAKPKPKKHNFLPKPIDGYDPLGCDEGALIPPPFTFIAPPEMPLAEFTPVPPEPEPMTFASEALLPDEEYGVWSAAPMFFVSGGGGGGFAVPLTPVIPGVPEPGVWALMLAMGAACWRRFVEKVAPVREDM